MSPSKRTPPVSLSADEACTWLSFALLESAELLDENTLLLIRDDGASLKIGGTGAHALSFEAEGATA
jgi:hypothetical protein